MPSAMTAFGSALFAATLALAGGPTAPAGPAGPSPSPAVMGAPAPDSGPGVTVVSHRGASGHAPENTLAAVDAAAALHIDWVEIDVQRTADGELVVLHDVTLDRTTDAAEIYPDRAPWELSAFTHEEITRLDAGSWYGPEFAGEPVPTLGQALDRIDGNGQKLLLEVKSPELYPGIEAEIISELRAHGWLTPRRLRDGLVVQSFDSASVRTTHRLDPRVRTGLLGSPPVAELPWHARYADQINPRHTSVTAEYVEAVQSLRGPHGRPLEVFVWTVNDGPTAIALASLGVDGVITDVPDVIRAALRPGGSASVAGTEPEAGTEPSGSALATAGAGAGS
ncbi:MULTISPECIES: glycerophosphodiester phosphodiesterase family protein [unclassified Streptomyces]|uniref:glycerophosphodiester phosphodiesterase n=2 Tax=Streptomyces TaxID=1883 RepID=UPI0021563C66|nr:MULTISPECIES: glycerophosphodiester phosphodiesterase family protein [unclassified Streptomyces]